VPVPADQAERPLQGSVTPVPAAGLQPPQPGERFPAAAEAPGVALDQQFHGFLEQVAVVALEGLLEHVEVRGLVPGGPGPEGEAEVQGVEDFAREHEVGGGRIPVHNAAAVQPAEVVTHDAHQVDAALLLEQLLQPAPLDHLHNYLGPHGVHEVHRGRRYPRELRVVEGRGLPQRAAVADARVELRIQVGPHRAPLQHDAHAQPLRLHDVGLGAPRDDPELHEVRRSIHGSTTSSSLHLCTTLASCGATESPCT